jgi:hypothetical protein
VRKDEDENYVLYGAVRLVDGEPVSLKPDDRVYVFSDIELIIKEPK